MKADPTTQLALLDLQTADATIDQVAHQTKALPEAKKVAEIESELTELNSERIGLETQVSDLSADQRKADAEVETVKTRRERNNERLSSGSVKNPKDLASLQHEIEALNRRISTLEDEELEVMEVLETAQADLDEIVERIAQTTAALDEAAKHRDVALGELTARGSQAVVERERLVGELPDDLLALYDRLRAQYDGMGAAALRARSCEACRLELNSADLREIAAQAPDEVVRCPECSRILVRTAESGL